MARLDATRATCFVFTEKEGLLSPVAHDLQIRVSSFELDIAADGSISARLDAASLRTVCAMKDGRPAYGVLSPKDLDDIDRAIVKDVLEPKRHPHIRFVSEPVDRSSPELAIRGTLTLKGRSQPMRLQARRQRDVWVAEVTLHQPDFGIKPFSAMLGTMRIKPDVVIRAEVPAALA